MQDTADYEKNEELAIRAGKGALANAPWLRSRVVPRTKGFFCELRSNDLVHPDFYAVHTVDGEGTKIFLSAWSGNYRSHMVNALAMNVNDMAPLLRVQPDVVNVYFACQGQIERKHMGDIMQGLVDALARIRHPRAAFDINVGKFETASLEEMIGGPVQGLGWDAGMSVTGYIRKHELPNLDPQPGHIIVGVSAPGLQSNGYTGARHKLLVPDVESRPEWKPQYKGRFSLHDTPSILQGKTVLEALETPTALYFTEASTVGALEDPSRQDIYGVNITGNGLGNFNRAGTGVSFHITDPLPLTPISMLLAQESGWDPKTTYTKTNAGMGFAFVVPSLSLAEFVVRAVNSIGESKAAIVGEVRASSSATLQTVVERPYEGKPFAIEGYAS